MKTNRSSSFVSAAFMLAGFGALGCVSSPSQNGALSTQQVALAAENNAQLAPEFPAQFAWLNTEKPLSLRALRGKIVLLDFWTYGCINCMHILPDLKKLERQYAKELVIISVHSAKFANEGDAQNIRNIVQRYNIGHPVVVDENMKIWESFGVNAWPSFVLIDPDGRVVGQTAGEGQYDLLNTTIARVASQFRAAGKLDETPLRFALERAKSEERALHFPGKVLADAQNNRLFIADSNANRVLICDLQGKVQSVAGSGRLGFQNGDFESATFRNPQGMALSSTQDVLYVADTDNHAIRALNLKTRTVSTIAGTGKQAAWRSSGGIGTRAALASPWDVLRDGDTLYLAMAGPHQIWRMNLKTQKVDVFSGTGMEARTDGEYSEAALAQPSGLASDGTRLFLADSESSSVRAVNFKSRRVSTLAGGGGVETLFSFGDRDGLGANALLQHPLGVAFGNGKIYVADTYNHKIKMVDARTNTVETLAGNGRGARDGEYSAAQFYEPGGLSLAGDALYIADTNNHAVRVVNLKTKQVSTLKLEGAPQPLAPEALAQEKPIEEKYVSTQGRASLASSATLQLSLQLPPRHHFNAESPQRLRIQVLYNGEVFSSTTLQGSEVKTRLLVPLKLPQNGTGKIEISGTVFYCLEGKNAVCKMQSVEKSVTFQSSAGGAKTLPLTVSIKDR